MAKRSSIAKNEKRKVLVKKYYAHRTALRAASVDMKLTEEERFEAQIKLQKLRRDTSPSRVVSRCHLTGRPRGVLQKFGLSRIAVRELGNSGLLPGITKASW